MLSLLFQLVSFMNVLFVICTNCEYIPTPPVANHTENGNLFQIRDSVGRLTPIFGLHLSGNHTQRGIAHGYLLCTQIIDWLEFYLIQTIFKGSFSNYNQFYKFLQSNIVFPPTFIAEIEGIIVGMKQSKQSLNVPSLNRNITKYDIMAINSYLEVTAQIPGPYLLAPDTMNNGSYDIPFGACTQFVATHNFTDDRHLLTGRNMDGECDESKVTVTHLIIFAIDATTSISRIVSILWPGFVGSLSAINEDGVYVMMNTGNMNKAKVIGDITPISIIGRSIIDNIGSNNFSSTFIQKYVIDNFASNQSASRQGTSGGGAILVIACDKDFGQESMFILEMDRLETVLWKYIISFIKIAFDEYLGNKKTNGFTRFNA